MAEDQEARNLDTDDGGMNVDPQDRPENNAIHYGEVRDLDFGGMGTDPPTPPGRDDIQREEEARDADPENGAMNLHPPDGPGRNDHHDEANRSEEPGPLNVEEIEATVEGTGWNIRLGNTDPIPPIQKSLSHPTRTY